MTARRPTTRRAWRRARRWVVLRNTLLAGVLATAPVVATLWLVWNLVAFVDRRVEPFVPEPFRPETHLPFDVPGFGLLIAVLAILAVGFFVTSLVGRMVADALDALFSRVPVLRSVYAGTKQVFETVFAQGAAAFRQVVLLEYPNRGTWAVGFVTGTTGGEVGNRLARPSLNVFLPATPNVTTGFLLFVPKDELRPLPISVEEGLTLVVSGGVVVPPGAGPQSQQSPSPIEVEEPAPPPPPRRTRHLRDCFLAGLVVTGPIGITLWLVWVLISFIDRRVEELVPDRFLPNLELPFLVPGMGVILVLLGLLGAGVLARGIVGRMLIRIGEAIVSYMPVVRSIYGGFKRFFQTLFRRDSGSFRQVVLFEYPRPGVWAVGFVTGRTRDGAGGRPPDSLHVFLPTTPNPTSGFLLFVPRSSAQLLRMSVEDGLKLVVSGGLVSPGARQNDAA